MSVEEWIKLGAVVATLAGIAATTTMAIVTIRLGRRRELAQQARDDRLRSEQLVREDAMRLAHRANVPRVTYDLDCHFVGMQVGEWVAEIRLIVDNKGMARRSFRSIRVKLRVIMRGCDLTSLKGGPRLNFPKKLIDIDLIDEEKEEYYYVEPGVRQVFSLPVKLPGDATFVLLHARFRTRFEGEAELTGEAAEDDQFDEERVFAAPSSPDLVRP